MDKLQLLSTEVSIFASIIDHDFKLSILQFRGLHVAKKIVFIFPLKYISDRISPFLTFHFPRDLCWTLLSNILAHSA